MGTHIKTTIEISDPLFRDAKRVAAREGTTLRTLIEAGLRSELERRRQPAPAFRLRRATFNGNGLQADVRGLSWDQLRELAYSGRGG